LNIAIAGVVGMWETRRVFQGGEGKRVVGVFLITGISTSHAVATPFIEALLN
jgi:hypothetical protein